jgi:hypothetical protein
MTEESLAYHGCDQVSSGHQLVAEFARIRVARPNSCEFGYARRFRHRSSLSFSLHGVGSLVKSAWLTQF